MSVDTRQDHVDFPIRSVRIGSLKTFPVQVDDGMDSKKTTIPLHLDESGVKFTVLPEGEVDRDKQITIKISSKRIERVEVYVLRGCPVIYIITDEKMAKSIRRTCNMNDRMSYFYDPKSNVLAEQHITVITDQDPLPFALAHNIQKIFKQIFKNHGKRMDTSFKVLSQRECNDKLVQCTLSNEEIQTKKRLAARNVDKVVEESGSEMSDMSTEEAVPEEVTVTKKKKDKSYKTVARPKDDKQPTLNRTEAFSPPEKSKVDISPNSARIVDHKKVHRARKSIPNRHRVVSIESQLRARVEEQEKESVVEQANEAVDLGLKRKHSGESDVSDAGRPSGGDSPGTEIAVQKKKRPKDPFLWTGRKKRKKSASIASSNGSTSPVVFDGLKVDSPITSTPVATTSNGTGHDYSNKSKTELKTHMVNGYMSTLRQSMNSCLDQTPLCTCIVKSPHSINFEVVQEIKCMAVDNVSGKPFGCNELISSHEMMRPSNKVPVIGLCNEHRERMIRHECCPGCGTFCSGGKFLVCIKNDNFPHRFHRDCMVLSGQMSNCPHCGGDSTSVKEVNLVPNMDKDLLLILAGRDPAKTKRKNYLQIRGCKSARMGYAKGSQYNPDFPPGVSVKFGRLDISTSTLMLGPQRDGLEELIQALQQEPLQKVRFQAKNFLQFVQQNNISKMIQMLTDGLEARIDTLNKALHEALPTCQLSTIHVLLESGADINSRDEEGNTPLIKAILLKNKELIIYLLFNKADVTVKDDDMGMTCFHHAAKEGYIEGCHLLMSYGRAKVNTVDDGGWTPIVWAAEHKQTETARYLLFYGANVKIIDNEGNTCLQWAALSGNLEILKMCLDCNSDVNHYNTHGDTALHIASRQNNYNCLTALLAHGADCNLKNRDGHLPIDCAQEKTLTWMSLKIHMCIRNACLIRREILPYNRERVLCKDMSRGYDKMPIVCVNAHDDAPCPTDPPNGFHYVTENVHTSQDTRINAVISGIQSCQCKDNCSTPDCTCGLISEQCWYASDGTLVPEFDILEPPLVFECNKMCSCSRYCKNRVVQNGIRYRLQIYRTQGMGWGLRALETIPRGAFVCEYVGELLTDDEADQREDDSYLFDLENKEGEIYCIDARNYGNVSRFINHLCEPNLVPIRVFVGHHDIRFPILAYFTTRVIQADEELGFDYGDRFWDVKCRQFTCQCGSPLCKYSAEVYRKKAEFETQQKETGNASEDVTKEGDDVTTTNNDVTN